MHFVCENFEFTHFQYIFDFAERILFSSEHQDLMKFHHMIKCTHSVMNEEFWQKTLLNYINKFIQWWVKKHDKDFITVMLMKLSEELSKFVIYQKCL